MDITNFISSFISEMVDTVSFVVTTLDNIKFFGFSLLSYIITLFIVSSVVPLVISIVQKVGVRRRGSLSRRSPKSEKSGDSNV